MDAKSMEVETLVPMGYEFFFVLEVVLLTCWRERVGLCIIIITC